MSGASARQTGAVSARLSELVDRARALAGLSDFGGDSWREGLEVLLRSARAESRFNAQGERAFCDSIVQTLANRLRIERAQSRGDLIHRGDGRPGDLDAGAIVVG